MPVTRWGAASVLVMRTCMTSTFSRQGTKDVISAQSPQRSDARRTLCHMRPAVSELPSCSGVKRAASCSADTPVADQQPFSVTHQKFRVLRLVCRFSELTGSNRKVS